MDFKCTVCEQTVTLPDEKLPRGRAFSIVCPACRGRIRIDKPLDLPPMEKPEPVSVPVREEAPETVKQDETLDLSTVGPETPDLVVTTEFESEEDDLLLYDENDRLALVLDEENKNQWADALEEKGFKIVVANSPEHALHKMKFTRFHLIALHESFGDDPLDQNLVYRNILAMEMSTRRKLFFAVVGNQFKTLNNMEAFAFSVNAVINQKDMDNLTLVLKKSFAETEALYKVFNESLHAMGKL